MKNNASCQRSDCPREFPDSLNFCNLCGAKLEAVAEVSDPYKTVVGMPLTPLASKEPDDSMRTMIMSPESNDEDILQIPEVFDPMKTVVSSQPFKFDKPEAVQTPSEPVVSAPPVVEAPTPEPPKFSEPSLSPPNFGDLTPPEPAKMQQPIANPFNDAPKMESPFNAPEVETPKPIEPPRFDSTPLPSESTPVESPFSAPQQSIPSPFAPEPSPFSEPMAPAASSSPFDSPFAPAEPVNQVFQQNDWNPPPAPVQSWQEQGIGADTPFQPPAAGVAGENKTLAIVSLVTGILSCLCCFSIITGPIALITGFIAKGNVSKDPSQYGGGGLALGGLITGAIGTLIGIGVIVLQILGAFAGRF